MVKAAVLIADGSEEIEAITPVDVLKRAGAECVLFSVCGEYVQGSHGIVIKADKTVDKLDMSEFDIIIIPGGLLGATNIAKSADAKRAIVKAITERKYIAAICASPAVVLAEKGLLLAKKATCYPAERFISALEEKYTGAETTVSGIFITASGPRAAMKFALEICKTLGITPKF